MTLTDADIAKMQKKEKRRVNRKTKGNSGVNFWTTAEMEAAGIRDVRDVRDVRLCPTR